MPQEATYGYADCSFFGEGTVAMSACGSWALGQLSATLTGDVRGHRGGGLPVHRRRPDQDHRHPRRLDPHRRLEVRPATGRRRLRQLAAGRRPGHHDHFFSAAGYSKYPVRTSVNTALAADPVASAEHVPGHGRPSDILPYAKPEPAYPWDISLAMGTAIEKSMRGGDIDAH